jgi:hypothetical protein
VAAACADHVEEIVADLAQFGGEITTVSGAPARLTLPTREKEQISVVG